MARESFTRGDLAGPHSVMQPPGHGAPWAQPHGTAAQQAFYEERHQPRPADTTGYLDWVLNLTGLAVTPPPPGQTMRASPSHPQLGTSAAASPFLHSAAPPTTPTSQHSSSTRDSVGSRPPVPVLRLPSEPFLRKFSHYRTWQPPVSKPGVANAQREKRTVPEASRTERASGPT